MLHAVNGATDEQPAQAVVYKFDKQAYIICFTYSKFALALTG